MSEERVKDGLKRRAPDSRLDMGEDKRIRSASFERRPNDTELCSVAGPSRRDLAGRHTPHAPRAPAPNFPALSALIEAKNAWLQNKLAFSTLGIEFSDG